MKKKRKLIIVGDSAFAEIAQEYFEVDTDYSVVCFAVESNFRLRHQLNGLPVLDFETINNHFPPLDHDIFVAITYTQLNRLRTRLVKEANCMGYHLASYISPRAFVWRNVTFGEHCFIFEGNTIQPFVTVGRNVVMWSGNHIGHHSVVRDNCFISSHAVISGFCDVGENSFIGVNATLSNNVALGKDNWLGPNTTIMKDTEPGALYKTVQSELSKISTKRFYKIRTD